MKPCSSCPFAPESPPGLWHPAHYLLIAYLGSLKGFAEGSDAFRSMGCHKFNGIVGKAPAGTAVRCGGWVRAARESFPVQMLTKFGRFSQTEIDEMHDGCSVLSPIEMARINGLDVDRLPPLEWTPELRDRYPHPDDWIQEVVELRVRIELDKEYARTFVVPGSPLDMGVSDETIRAALGDKAADRYEERDRATTTRRPRQTGASRCPT